MKQGEYLVNWWTQTGRYWPTPKSLHWYQTLQFKFGPTKLTSLRIFFSSYLSQIGCKLDLFSSKLVNYDSIKLLWYGYQMVVQNLWSIDYPVLPVIYFVSNLVHNFCIPPLYVSLIFITFLLSKEGRERQQRITRGLFSYNFWAFIINTGSLNFLAPLLVSLQNSLHQLLVLFNCFNLNITSKGIVSFNKRTSGDWLKDVLS